MRRKKDKPSKTKNNTTHQLYGRQITKCLRNYSLVIAGRYYTPFEIMKRTIFILSFIFISFISHGQREDFVPYKKNDIRLDLKLPHINYLSVNPKGEFKEDKVGFNGYGIGIEYNYSDKRFLETGLSIVFTFEWPFPIHVDSEYNKAISSYYLSLTDNFIVHRFTIGYGLNYSSNNWSEWHRDFDTIGLPTTDGKYYSNKAIGITSNSYYRIGKSLNLGIIYRPTMLKINEDIEWVFEHLISFELNWRIKLNGKNIQH